MTGGQSFTVVSWHAQHLARSVAVIADLLLGVSAELHWDVLLLQAFDRGEFPSEYLCVHGHHVYTTKGTHEGTAVARVVHAKHSVHTKLVRLIQSTTALVMHTAVP